MSQSNTGKRSLWSRIWDPAPAPERNLVRRPLHGSAPRFGIVLGAAAISLLFTGLLIQLPAPALHGEGIVSLIGLAAVTAAVLVEFAFDPGSIRWVMCFGLVIGLSSAAIAAVQPGGTAVIGCYVAVGISSRRLPRLNALVVAIPVTAVVIVLILLTASNSVFTAIWSLLGFTFTYMISRLVLVREEQHARERALIEEEKRALEARTEAAALAERGRIAREMHDVLAHSLSALSVELEGARMLARRRGADPDLELAIERANEHAKSGLAEARSAIEALRGEDLPGAERLTSMAERFSTEQHVPCRLDVSGEPRRLPSDASLAIYRTAQEALTNVRKHADPDRVELRLTYGEAGTKLEVADHRANGDGSSEGEGRDGAVDRALSGAGAGYGVSGMRERAELLGGRLDAGPTSDGFRVELWLPSASPA